MSTIRKRKNGKWQVIIRKKNYPNVTRTFLEKGTASKWSNLIESQMDRKIFKDMSGAEGTTLSLLVEKYRDEIVPEMKSAVSLTYKLNKLLKDKICFYNLLQLNSAHAYEYKKRIAAKLAPNILFKSPFIPKFLKFSGSVTPRTLGYSASGFGVVG